MTYKIYYKNIDGNILTKEIYINGDILEIYNDNGKRIYIKDNKYIENIINSYLEDKKLNIF